MVSSGWHTKASARPATPPAMRWVLKGTFSLPPLALGLTMSPVRPPPYGLLVDVDIVVESEEMAALAGC